jgi:hypothetical protein
MAKIKLTVWVNEPTGKLIRSISAANSISISQVAAEYLESAMQEKSQYLGTELVVPAVEAAINREIGHMAQRLSRLLARTALESATTRRIAYNVLLRQGVNPSEAKLVNDEAWQRAITSLKSPLVEINEILAQQENR